MPKLPEAVYFIAACALLPIVLAFAVGWEILRTSPRFRRWELKVASDA